MSGIEGAWLYMLHCRGDRLYCGVCLELSQRFELHCSGKGAKFTKAFPPERLAVAWHFASPLGVVQGFEYRLKKLAKKQKKQLILQPELIANLLRVALPDYVLADVTAFKNRSPMG